MRLCSHCDRPVSHHFAGATNNRNLTRWCPTPNGFHATNVFTRKENKQ